MSTLDKRIQVAVYQKAKKGEAHCGDSYFYVETENEFVCAIADGLGSGKFAEESSKVVIDTIKNNINAPEEQLVQKCNKVLVGKRGVVLGMLKMNFKSRKYTYSSIGNIGVMTIAHDKAKKRLISNPGYLVSYVRQFKIIQGDLENKMNFVMFSDGVTDTELSQKFFLNNNVDEIIQTYMTTSEEVRKDDTTLIVMRYTE